MADTLLRSLVDLRDKTVQKTRIGLSNRKFAFEGGTDVASKEQQMVVNHYLQRFMDLEEELDKTIAEIVTQYPVYDYISQVKGIGPIYAAQLIALIDIDRAPHCSSLWRYAGMAVIGGKIERPTKGEKLHYNPRLKTICYRIALSFRKTSSSPYNDIHDNAYNYYQVNRPEWTDSHCKASARRKMVKIFLQHLWLTWRKLENLPVSEPYVQSHLGHTHIHKPEDFGWPLVGMA